MLDWIYKFQFCTLRVDDVDGDKIKLTRSDSSDDMHHYMPLDSVDRIDDNRVYLKQNATIPVGLAS